MQLSYTASGQQCVRAGHALQEHLSILFHLLSEKGKHISMASTSQDSFRVTFQEFGRCGVGGWGGDIV